MSRDVIIPVKVAEASAEALAPTIAIRNSSFLHLDAAINFVRESFKIQKDYVNVVADEVKNTQKSAYRAHIIGALLTSVAFLEAAINEVFLDAVESMPEDQRKRKGRNRAFTCDEIIPYGVVQPLDRPVINSLAQMWLQKKMIESWDEEFPSLFNFLDGDKRNHSRPNIARNWSTLDKYQLALYLNSKSRFESQPLDKAHHIKKDIFTLISFRDYLVHFKPGWSVSTPAGKKIEPIEDDAIIIKSQVERLIKRGRPARGYSGEKDFLASGFPLDCLRAAFAMAALHSILQFDDEFSKRMGIQSATSRFDIGRKLKLLHNL